MKHGKPLIVCLCADRTHVSMHINYSFKLCDEKEKKYFREYFEQKLPSFQKFFTRVRVQDIDASLERFVKKSAYKATLSVKTDHGIFLAWEDDHTIAEAIDFAKDKVIKQMRRTFDKEKSKGHRGAKA